MGTSTNCAISCRRPTVSPTLPFSIALMVPTLTPMPVARPRNVTPACLRNSRTTAPLSVIGCSATLNSLWGGAHFRRLMLVICNLSHRARYAERLSA
ncbi:Uncharacterised protein [Mycobacteroides abscessus subsp. abscessus]|nr:Uncharacterised protein [Mycobacteroides abscessus subsp. abscessus]